MAAAAAVAHHHHRHSSGTVPSDTSFPRRNPPSHCCKKALRLPFMTPRASSSSSHGRKSAPASADSYLSMWKRAKDRQEQEQLRQYHDDVEKENQDHGLQTTTALEVKTQQFSSLLQVPAEERDRVQRMQVVDRAAAALAAANALLAEKASFQNSAATLPPSYAQEVSKYRTNTSSAEENKPSLSELGNTSERTSTAHLTLGAQATPGPDFWTWSPPTLDEQRDAGSTVGLSRLKADVLPQRDAPALLEKEAATSTLDIPFESKKSDDLSEVFQRRAKPSLPPLQSLLEVQEMASAPAEEATSVASSVSIPDIEEVIASFVQQESLQEGATNHGVNPDGSRWWKETGKELRSDGVTCTWTVISGINADGTEWQEKFWEAFDDLDYKELGAEKSGRDAAGNVWREFWKEAMWQDLSTGLLHMEKTADKWAKNGQASEWHEKWWEHYNASGYAEKWADKWCKIDEATILEPGHAHIWHERWGEKFDGQGAALKYTDKWAERAEFGGGRSKWGDKWDENFNKFGHGVKQGETWWEGASGERWNRTWGEGHNGSGWVHKYGRSSSGEQWDTHEPQDTWYERHPHYSFDHCFENSRELRRVASKKNSVS